MSTQAKVHDAWSGDPPDWVVALAIECDRTSQGRTAKRLNYSAGVVNNVLSNSYAASTAKIEETVRGVLMREVYSCPVLGEIPKQDCRQWRDKARNFNNANTQAVTMFRACSKCARFKEDIKQ